ncbi:MAG TPA: PrgI family protein [bacterium]|jgi:hypothetical protein|nr:PrgI family protein [bacterium]
MQQFTVPQFIDVEDKVVGPLSVRQFLTLLGTFGLCFLFYKIFVFTVFVILTVIAVGIGASFAFVKISGVPLHYFLVNFAQSLRHPPIRVWAHDNSLVDDEPEIEVFKSDKVAPRGFTSSHLNQLSLIVDTRGYYSGESEETDIFSVNSKVKDIF